VFCPDCGTWNRAMAAECNRCGSVLPDLSSAPLEQPDEEITLVRRALGGRYRVIRRLGGGGMASVYFAEHVPLGRQVAVKLLHPFLAREAEMRERFRREAEAAAQLVHPHVCPILDFGLTESAVYLVMPYLKGGSLAARVYVHRTVAPAGVAAAAAQVATGLDYAHRRGIVHRDVKPDNILYDEDGNAVITDFGIATARFHGRLTATGRAMGTPHYMSPEQAMGKLIDGRSDIYAMGVVMYEALVGIPPFDGADAFSVGYKHVHEAPVPLEEVDSRLPAALSRVVMRCLVKNPADRYATGVELAEALIDAIAAIGSKQGAPDASRLATIARLPGRQAGQPVR
jgi:serine/threonine protein kinase